MTVGCGGSVNGPDLAERLKQLAFAADMINLEFAKVAAAFAETDEYDEQGFVSPISWIKANCHMSGAAARARVVAGQQLECLSQSRAAMGMGEIGFAHFALIAGASAAVGERLDETKLLTQARRLGISHSSTPATTHATRPTRKGVPPKKRRA